MLRLMSIFLMFLLTACSTPYANNNNPLNAMGGYGDETVTSNLIKVYFQGNGSTSDQKAAAYVIRRAAEMSQQKRLPYFAAYQTITDAIHSRPTGVAVNNPLGQPYAYAYIEYNNKKAPGDFVVADVLASYKLH